MEAIAYAMYFRMFGKTYRGSWLTFSPSIVSQSALLEGKPDGWDEYRRMLLQIKYTQVPTPQPESLSWAFISGMKINLFCLCLL